MPVLLHPSSSAMRHVETTRWPRTRFAASGCRACAAARAQPR